MYSFSQTILTLSLVTAVTFQISLQYCPEEVSTTGIRVTWYQSLPGNHIRSDPLCIHNGTLVTRNCTNNLWTPPLDEVLPCYTAVKYLDPSSCPPGFETISDKISRFCYQIEEPSPWDQPCFQSGGATTIMELNKNELDFLFSSLNTTNHKYFWLPAHRPKTFLPIVWLIPGPNWGRVISTNSIIPFKPLIFKNCLLLDTEQRMLITGTCSNEYPSLCFYKSDFQQPAKCPMNYHAFRHMLDDGKCYGIEKSKTKLTFQEFLSNKCKTPMGNGRSGDLRRYIYSKLSEANHLSDDTWCWFATPLNSFFNYNSGFNISERLHFDYPHLLNVINNNGSIALMNSVSSLPCMACETDIIYGETELSLEYDEENQQLYLTVYFPSGLWKYNTDDKGVQCFSDADGFSRVIDIYDSPMIETLDLESIIASDLDPNVEKFVYIIDLVTERSARYWCEGHNKSFSLITTEKIVVNPQGNQVHVFSLVLKLKVQVVEVNNIDFIVSDLTQNITSIFKSKKALVMDILEYNSKTMQVLIHLHVPVNYTYREESRNLLYTFEFLKSKAEIEFPRFDYLLVNMSSAVYCLPTTSVDSITLNWDITPIGHIAAPLEFCLQANGLPVNRQCHGSYLLGSFWGEVEGQCDISYSPSNTTKFLFSLVNRKTNFISRFLTCGLEFVLNDLDILIPADIYYLSVAFQMILTIGRQNMSSIETGDIKNIAWIMDRMMNINNSNLRLAQTLNSTNAILESTNNIIELITLNNNTVLNNDTNTNTYQLAVQPRFIVQVSYPRLNNITGIAVIRNVDSDNFTDMIIKPLYKNTTFNDVLLIENLEVATWLPYHIIDNLRKLNNESDGGCIPASSMHVVVKVYNDNAVFQELSENKLVVSSRIIEVTIPDYITNLEYPIPLVFKEIKKLGLPKACGYWDFKTDNGNIPGSWSRRGCFLKANFENITICECYHLTHFAQLFNLRSGTNSENNTINEKHEKALNIITLIGSFLSLLGIVGLWITATVFDTWRKKTGTKVLLQLSLSIALPLILIIVFNLDNSIIVESEGWHVVPRNMVAMCVTLGALFHYSVLANFMWMLITAILQFIRYVRVLGVSRPSRFMVKLALIGWGIPCFPVLAVLFVDYENYVPTPSPGSSFCYPNGLYMIAGVIVPVCGVLLVNVILFLLVIKSISKSTYVQASDKSLICAQFRLSIFLFFLLGLTWIFGVASFSGDLIWSYLFCLTSTVQGMVLFIYFVICDPNTRNMWITVMKPQFARSRTSITTVSSG